MIENLITSPLVSVVIPTYNRETLLGDCARSALGQTNKHIELIIVDNASTDQTWRVCEELQAEDKRVRIFRNPKNLGPVENWIRGVNEAKGDYTKILFSDDLIYPEFLTRSLALLQNPSVGFVFSAVRTGAAPENSQLTTRWKGRHTGLYKSQEFLREAFFGGDIPVSPGAALFRTKDLKKNILRDVPGPRIRDWCEHGGGVDFLTYLLTAMNYTDIGFIAEPLVFFRSHPESITSSAKVLHLADCYRQARVWAAQLVNPREHQRIIAYLWLLECLRECRLLSFSEFSERYCLKPLPKLDYWAIAFSLSRLTLHGFWSVRKKLLNLAFTRS